MEPIQENGSKIKFRDSNSDTGDMVTFRDPKFDSGDKITFRDPKFDSGDKIKFRDPNSDAEEMKLENIRQSKNLKMEEIVTSADFVTGNRKRNVYSL